MTTANLAAIAMASLVAGCSRAPAPVRAVSATPAPAVSDIAAHYDSYRKITSEAVFVNPELATLCVGASPAQVDAARATQGPHAHTAILVYMNESAAEAFARGGRAYAAGAVIVKQKTLLARRPDAPRAADRGVGGMVKRAPGFDPAHGDWEYFYFEDPARIETGRIASCVQCHAGARKTDYVFGTWQTHAGEPTGGTRGDTR